jgi:pimeloyl-ACP methyl ester carboxylesterase
VLLFHGWGGRPAQLAPLAEALAERGLAAVAFHAPGHGRSSGRVASVPLYAEAIAAAQAATGARAAVGHSFGGAALAFAASRGLALDAAVLVGAPPSPALYIEAFCDALSLPVRARAALRARLEARVGHRTEELELVRAVLRARSAALVVHDRDDREVAFAGGEALAGAWPGGQLLATAGLGHRRILRDPGVLSAAAAFIAERLPRCGCGRLALTDGGRCASCAVANDLWEREGRQGRGLTPAARPTGS